MQHHNTLHTNLEFGRPRVWTALTLLAALATGCKSSSSSAGQSGSGSESTGASSTARGGNSTSDVSQDAGAEDEQDDEGRLFAVPTQVYGADFATSTSYVPIVPTLNVDRISLDDARELDGRASVGRVGPYLFMASSSLPVVERFRVSGDGSLEEAGRLSFANRGLPDYFSIDPWGAVFVDDDKAYIFNSTDGSHVIWNPSTLKITGEIPGPDIAEPGYYFESVAVVRGTRMYRIFTLLNYESWEFLAEPQYLAVYDLETDELLDLVEETRCPQLYSRPFLDESGAIYFSGWVWTPGLTLTSDYPTSCALRVGAGEDTFDPDWQLDFAVDVTDGREAGVMRYLGNGKALLDVFHDERTTIDSDTDPEEIVNTPNWRLWTIDLENGSGEPLEGLDFKAAGYQDATVDGRTFLMVPNDDYSETTAYEVVDGQAIEGFKIQGSSYDMVRAR